MIQPRRARNYQQQALEWSDSKDVCGFYVDQRMGKCLLAIRRAKRWGIIGPKLIITKLSAFEGWQNELKNENQTTALELLGTARHRHKLLYNPENPGNSWFIINVQGYRALLEISQINWGLVIADESRFLSDPQSEQSKFYTKHFKHVKHKIIMIGTPDYKDKLDFYQQLYFLNPTLLAYKNYWDFRDNAFYQHGYDFYMKEDHAKVFDKVMSDTCLFMSRSDYNIGRKKEYKERLLKLPRKLKPIYETLEEEYILEVESQKVLEKTMYATQTHMWLMRLCGGFVNDNFIWLGKVKEVLYLLNHKIQDKQVLVVCRFTNENNMLLEQINNDSKLKRKGISATQIHGRLTRKKRKENIDAFRAGKHRVFVAQPTIIAHGVDLKNAEVIIVYSPPRGGEITDQVMDRLVTLDDNKVIIIYVILMKNTIDYDIWEKHIIGTTQRDVYYKTIKRRQIR